MAEAFRADPSGGTAANSNACLKFLPVIMCGSSGARLWPASGSTAEVTIDDEVILRDENEANDLAISSVHRLATPGKIDLATIEVPVGSYPGEDDIVRFEGVCGR